MAMYIKDTLKASISGNAGTATKLATARTLTIGNTGKSFDGSGNVSWTLAEIGAAASSHGTHVRSSAITTGYDTAFRTKTKGDANSGSYFSTVRTDTASVNYAPQYGSGIAWGQGDTHGYLNVSYSSAVAYLAGGSGDKLNWVKQIAFSDHTHSYLPLSGGTMTGKISGGPMTGTWVAAAGGSSFINSTGSAGTFHPMLSAKTTNGGMTLAFYQNALQVGYLVKANIDAGTNTLAKNAILMDESGNGTWPGTVSATTFKENGTALSSKYAAASHSHTLFTRNSVGDIGWGTTSNQGLPVAVSAIAYWNGAYSGTSSNLAYCAKGAFGTIVTKNSGDYLGASATAAAATKLATARTFTIGGTGKSFNGTANVSWTLKEIMKGQGLDAGNAMNTLYFNNAGVDHVGRLSCYRNTTSNLDYVQLGLYNVANSGTVNTLNVYPSHSYTANEFWCASNIRVNGKRLHITASAPGSPSTGDIWIDI